MESPTPPRTLSQPQTPTSTPPPLSAPPADRKEKGILSSLLRNLSLSKKVTRKDTGTPPRRSSDSDTVVGQRKYGDGSLKNPRRQGRRTEAQQGGDGNGKKPNTSSGPGSGSQNGPNGSPPRRANSLKMTNYPKAQETASSKPNLTAWPPDGINDDIKLPPQQALDLVSRGAPSFQGQKHNIPHTSEQHFFLYAGASTSDVGKVGAKDMAKLHDSMTQLMTMRIYGRGYAAQPWETLEQPSYAFHYGRLPGTVTLNQWTCMSSSVPPILALRDPGVMPRPMDLEQVMERLQELQAGLEDDDEDLLYKILYKRILRDPDKARNPHKTLDKQITDLILVLSGPDWIDFTNPKNHVVTRFIFKQPKKRDSRDMANGNTGQRKGEAAEAQYHKFMHQLLLSMELELRVHSKLHGEWAKERLMRSMPPSIQWSLALARRWRDYVRVERVGATSNKVKLRYKLKRRQVKLLRRFAETMKWPNLAETLKALQERDEDSSLDTVSSDAFAFSSGLVLPGPSYPFLIMNTLIDLDPDPATDSLALLSHLYPSCGFQYRSSYTYWSASSIVGKVLAPTCPRSFAGWIGPARPTADLGRSQIARIKTRKGIQKMHVEDVETMEERTLPLGPEADLYPVDEYELVTVDAYDFTDVVRVERLAFHSVGPASDVPPAVVDSNVPGLFDASIQFAIDGVSWPLKLTYDVTFITAWACYSGPHPLFFDYLYDFIKADEVVDVHNWGGLHTASRTTQAPRANLDPRTGASAGARSSRWTPGAAAESGGASKSEQTQGAGDDEKVLVVDARGVADCEVLARAWCAHWGLGAVVADLRRTCMACAIREAYAATVTVVILIDETLRHDDDVYE